MSVKECVGYLLAVLVLVWHFGTVFEQGQQQIIAAVQALDRDAQAVKTRVTELEKVKNQVTEPDTRETRLREFTKKAEATPPVIEPIPSVTEKH